MPSQYIPTSNKEAEEADFDWIKAQHDVSPPFNVSPESPRYS